MNILEATRVLAGAGPGDQSEAAQVVREELRRSATRQRPRASKADLEDAVSEAFVRVLRRLRRGPLEATEEAAARSYLRLAARSALVDRERHAKRLVALEQAEEVAASAEGPPTEVEVEDGLLARAKELGRRVLAAAIRRFPRARASLEQGYEEIRALAFRETTVVSLLGGEEAAGLKQRNALYKRHERTRRRLSEALRGLEAGGAIDAEDAQLARSYLLFLGIEDGSAER